MQPIGAVKAETAAEDCAGLAGPYRVGARGVMNRRDATLHT
jgi:hypothetical protein